jgi:hypothetical protein
VIHSVGAITDAFDYKTFFKSFENFGQVGLALLKQDGNKAIGLVQENVCKILGAISN